MNSTQVQNTVAPIVGFVAGLLAAKFAYFDAATWSAILMGLVGAGATIWGAVTTRNHAIISKAATLPEVKKVITDAKTASAIPANNVVAG
jgi:uncharacterized membrane protein YeaQ/YmgE (transglycosylase-associated protein family)